MDELRAALTQLMGPNRKVRTIARETGLAASTVSEIRSGRRGISRNALNSIVLVYAKTRATDWVAAWERCLPATPPATVSNRPVPRELPADVIGFVGRDDYLAALDDLLLDDGRSVRMTAIVGTAGVGKTALAVRWAHANAHHFPDGSIYVDLRGYDLDRPLTAGLALGRVLRSLGVPDAEQPADDAERAARFRTAVDGRRLLLLLDNVLDTEQVRPLLPGSTSCATVITSRGALSGLRDRDGVSLLELGEMPPDNGVRLFETLYRARSAEERDALPQIVALCAGLPLAIRIAAGLVADSRGGLSAVLDGLSDRRRRLDFLDPGDDPRTAVRSVLSWSSAQLDAATAATFRHLGLHPGPDASAASLAALGGIAQAELRRHVRILDRFRLLHSRDDDRISLHDLLRDYAREEAEQHMSEHERDAAYGRLEAWYLRGARDAIQALDSGHPSASSPSKGLGWLDRQRPGIHAMVDVASAREHWSWISDIAATLWRYLHIRGLYADALDIHTCAVAAAQHLADLSRTARALEHLGIAQQMLGRYDESLRCLEQAVELHELGADRIAAARAIGHVGTVYARQGAHETAVGWMERSLAMADALGNDSIRATALNNLGLTHHRWGRYEPAIGYLDRALDLARHHERAANEAMALNNRGLVLRRLGRRQEAHDDIRAALKIAEAIGADNITGEVLDNLGALLLGDDRPGEALDTLARALDLHRAARARAAEAETLDNIGLALVACGRPEQALRHHLAALDLARAIGDHDRAISAHIGCGACLGETDPDEAERHLETALRLATEVDNLDQRARALDMLGGLHLTRGDTAGTQRLWIEAINLYDQARLPEAADLRRRIDALKRTVR